MTWLTTLPSGLLVVLSLGFAFVVAAGSRALTLWLVPVDERDHVQSIAGPMMPALGATFAVLMALTLASEAGYRTTAQNIVGREAAEAARLGWATTSPGVDGAGIRTALAEYLRTTRAEEWRDRAAERGSPRTSTAIGVLERAVRIQAARPEIGSPASTELLAAVDAMTTGRRERLDAASRQLPLLYVLTLVVSGAALIANAAALTFRSRVRTALLVGGLTTAVALSLALLFALSGAWRGPLVVSGQSIDLVIDNLRTGYFHS